MMHPTLYSLEVPLSPLGQNKKSKTLHTARWTSVTQQQSQRNLGVRSQACKKKLSLCKPILVAPLNCCVADGLLPEPLEVKGSTKVSHIVYFPNVTLVVAVDAIVNWQTDNPVKSSKS